MLSLCWADEEDAVHVGVAHVDRLGVNGLTILVPGGNRAWLTLLITKWSILLWIISKNSKNNNNSYFITLFFHIPQRFWTVLRWWHHAVIGLPSSTHSQVVSLASWHGELLFTLLSRVLREHQVVHIPIYVKLWLHHWNVAAALETLSALYFLHNHLFSSLWDSVWPSGPQAFVHWDALGLADWISLVFWPGRGWSGWSSLLLSWCTLSGAHVGGGSLGVLKQWGSKLLKYTVTLLDTSLSTVKAHLLKADSARWIYSLTCVWVRLTHDLTDGDRLWHHGRRAASSNVYCHYPEVDLLSHGQATHHISLPLAKLIVCHHPLSVWNHVLYALNHYDLSFILRLSIAHFTVGSAEAPFLRLWFTFWI